MKWFAVLTGAGEDWTALSAHFSILLQNVWGLSSVTSDDAQHVIMDRLNAMNFNIAAPLKETALKSVYVPRDGVLMKGILNDHEAQEQITILAQQYL